MTKNQSKRKPSRTAISAVRELIALMDAGDLTYETIAIRAGYSAPYIYYIKSGRINPTVLALESFGQVIGYHLEWVKDE